MNAESGVWRVWEPVPSQGPVLITLLAATFLCPISDTGIPRRPSVERSKVQNIKSINIGVGTRMSSIVMVRRFAELTPKVFESEVTSRVDTIANSEFSIHQPQEDVDVRRRLAAQNDNEPHNLEFLVHCTFLEAHAARPSSTPDLACPTKL